MYPIWAVKEVEAKEDYTLHLTFADGSQKVYDARPLLEQAIYSPLHDLAFFLSAKAEGGAVVWSDEVDIDPEHLYKFSEPLAALEGYIRQTDPGRTERSQAWQAAIGLQAVDGLQPSEYLLETAKEHIEGNISIDQAQAQIQSYYEQRSIRSVAEANTKEADIVSARIAMLLEEKAFHFSYAEWMAIHRRLFTGVFSHAGQLRQYNISKREWILKGDTVSYASWMSLRDLLEYDFSAEKSYSYKGLSMDAVIKHFAKFASDIWQIHPFSEGNTRATAVFLIKYFRTLGFDVSNELFEKNSWYFRNALVRANYSDLKNGIHASTSFLELFFSDLLLGTSHDLSNRQLHIDFCSQN